MTIDFPVKVHLYGEGVRKWTSTNNTHVRGYLFQGDTLLEGKSLCKAVSQLQNIAAFEQFVKTANGSFAIISQHTDALWAATDRMRSIPIAFSTKAPLWVTDHLHEHLQDKEWALDHKAAQELAHAAYALGHKTLIADVCDLSAGHLLVLDKNGPQITQWYRHLHSEAPVPLGDPKQRVLELSDHFIQRAINSVHGRQIAIPLSGGYDSRYIAAMVRRARYENVVCYSYGRKESFEVQTAEKVAKALGFKWIFIEYDQASWQDYLEDSAFHNFASNLTSLPLCQDFPALKYLTQKRLIAPDAVIFPGYCGDVLGGSFIPDEINSNSFSALKKTGLAGYLQKRHFCLQGSLPDKAENLEAIDAHLASTDFSTERAFIRISEDFVTQYRLSKFIINGVRVFEYFGYDWRLPLWDNELCDFWYTVDHQHRKGGTLYTKILMDTIFADYDIAIYKGGVTSIRKKILKSSALNTLYQLLKPTVKKLSRSVLNEKKYIDFNSYSDFEHDLKAKVTLAHPKNPLNFNAYYALWYLQSLDKGFVPRYR